MVQPTTSPVPPAETADLRAPQGVTEVLRLLHALMQGRALTAPEAAKHLAFQPPAVRRHLHALTDVLRGRVVADKDGKSMRYRFVWPRDQQSDVATALALELARTALVSLRGSAIDAKLAELVEEHQARADATHAPPDLARVLFPRTRAQHARGMDADAVDQLVRAIVDRRLVAFDYAHFGGKRAHVVIEPWTLVPSDEGLFCYGRCVDSEVTAHLDTRRLFKVARMHKVRRHAATFVYPPADVYQPADVFRHCFGVFLPEDAELPEVIVLHLHPRWAAFLQHEPLHPSQTPPLTLPDGRIRVEMQVYPTLDVERWLRGLGTEVDVVAPSGLRARVHGERGRHHGD